MNILYKLTKSNLKELESKKFILEKDIQKLVEKNTQELFGLDLIKSEFIVGEFRLDSLCFDNESNSFVIIEYKRDQTYSVIDQGYSYLATMLNNKSDFILEYNENSDHQLKREDVNWKESRIIFISPSFTIFQKNSVNFNDIPFELWEIKKFEDDIVAFNKIISTSKEAIQKLESKKSSIINTVSKEVEVYNYENHFADRGPEIQQLYDVLIEKISSFEDFSVRGFSGGFQIRKRDKIVTIWINLRKDHLFIDVVKKGFFGNKKNIDEYNWKIDDPKNLFEINKTKNKELYQYRMYNTDNLDYLVMVLKQIHETKISTW